MITVHTSRRLLKDFLKIYFYKHAKYRNVFPCLSKLVGTFIPRLKHGIQMFKNTLFRNYIKSIHCRYDNIYLFSNHIVKFDTDVLEITCKSKVWLSIKLTRCFFLLLYFIEIYTQEIILCVILIYLMTVAGK